MSKCTYRIGNLTFNDELELNKYITENKLSTITDSYIFSLGINDKVKATLERVLSSPNKNLENKDLLGTTEFLDIEHFTGESDELGNPIKKLLSPVYNKENRIKFSLENTKEEDREKVMSILNKKIEQEDEMTSLGTLYHTLLYHMINGNGPSPSNVKYQKTLNIFESDEYLKVQTNNTKGTYDIRQSVNNLMIQIWNYFNEAYLKKGGTIMAKVTMKSGEPKLRDSKGLKGRLDVIGITSEGHLNIYDLKLSTDLFDSWDPAKVLRTDYQLGIYRQLCAANGFKVDTSALKILPIKMDYGNINSLQFDSIRNRTIEGEGMQSSGLLYDGGKISETLKRLIPAPLSKTVIENSDLDKRIVEDLHTILPKFETKSKNILDEERLFEKYKNNVVNGEYFYYDEIEQKNIKVKSEEELKKSLHDYVERSKAAKTSKILQLKAGLLDAINTNKIPDNLLNTKMSSNVTANKMLTLSFEKYTKKGSGWRVIDDIDELTNIGIIALENINSGIIEFMSITSENLNTMKEIGLGHTILGKFMSDDDAYKYEADIMSSSVRNLETMKVLSVLNNIPELFKNRKLGTIKIIDYLDGKSEVINLQQSLDNFNILSGKAKIKNNFTNGLIKSVDMFDYIKAEIENIIVESDDKALKSIINGALNISVADSKRDSLLQLVKMLNSSYPAMLKGKSLVDKQSFNTQVEMVNALASWGVSEYSGLGFINEAQATRYGFNFGELFTFLGAPFVRNLRRTTKEGYKITGLLQGLEMSTSSSIPNKNLIKVNNLNDGYLLRVREAFNKEQSVISAATKEFLNNSGKSNINRLIIGNNYDLYDDLFVTSDNGKLLNNLSVKNPFDSRSGLNQVQSKYLRTILWSINKFKIPKLTSEQRSLSYQEAERLEEVQKYISSGEYFEIPIKRASNFQQLRNLTDIGVGQYFGKKWNEMKDVIDQRMLVEEQEEFVNSKDKSTMPNHHRMSRSVRQSAIDNNGIYYFERNLDLVAMDNAFVYTKEIILNDVLPIIQSFATMVKFRGEMTGEDFTPMLQALQDQVNITLFNEPILDKELKDFSKAIQVARTVTSTAHVMARPILLFKELTVGQFRNIILASKTNDGYSNSFSHKSLMQANKIMYGHGIGKYGKLFKGEGDLADFTLVQAFNNVYGFANMDINQIIEKGRTDRYGIVSGLSKWMYWTNTFPDFVNRMTLFLAKMIEDKAFSAHSLDEYGNLIYDFKKDERFAEFVKHKDDKDYTSKTFLEQKAMYRAMLEEFQTEGYLKKDGSFLKFGDDLPRAYTTKQKVSLKEFSDTMYGFYDQESKSLSDHKAIGLVYKQFMTYWTSKLKLWGKSRGTDTSQGSYKHLKNKEGQLLYWKTEIDPNGNISRIETTEDDGTMEPIIAWEGDVIEGLFYSLAKTFLECSRFNFKDAFNDKQRMTNVKLALRDILVGINIYNLFKLMLTGGSGKTSDVDNDLLIPYKILTKAMVEFDPINSIFGGLSWDPAFHKTLVSIQQDGLKMLTGDSDIADALKSNISLIQDISFNEEK